ncbi:MAG: ABC transporter substrate-binding protein [Thermoanaerobaculia bacterium]
MKSLDLSRWLHVRAVFVTALAVAASLLCGRDLMAATALPTDTLRIGIGGQPDTLELSQVTNSATASLLEHVVETLVTVDATGRIAPRLAQRWTVSSDGLQFTFYLPAGVTFQDGTPLTASAVVWNVNRLQNRVALVSNCAVVAQELAAIQSIVAVDSTTVLFKLSRPVPNFLATLSWIAWGVLSPQSASVSGNQLYNIQHPVGTGPYSFTSLTTSQLQLTRFDGYRGVRPYYAKLSFNFIASPQDRETGLANDQLDVILLPSAKDVATIAQDSRFAVLTQPSLRSIFVNLNNQKAPFNDVRVRQAVNLAIDKQALIDQVLLGNATALDSPVAPGVFGYCSVGSYAYDPAAAQALLAAAKVAPGTPLRMLTPNGRYLEDVAVAQRIAGYLNAVGFAVTLEVDEWPVLLGQVSRPPTQVTADLHLFGWAPTFPDAGWQLPQLYDSKKWPPNGPASSFYKNAAVDSLLDAASQEQNPATRSSDFCNAEQKIWADAPAAFLWVQSFYVVSKAGLTNIVSLPNEKISVAFAKPTG